MPISQTPLEVENYYVQSLRFDTNDDYVDEQPSTGELSVDFAVFTHPEDALRVQVSMLIAISETEAAKNEPYTLQVDLYGFFRFKPDTPEETVRKMVFSNAVPILYGIARGCVAQATATSFMGRSCFRHITLSNLLSGRRQQRSTQSVSGTGWRRRLGKARPKLLMSWRTDGVVSFTVPPSLKSVTTAPVKLGLPRSDHVPVLHPRPPRRLVLRQQSQNLLACRRRAELWGWRRWIRTPARSSPRTRPRCRGAERRLADGFAARMFTVFVSLSIQVDVEHLRHVADVRDLVRRRRVRQQLAVGVVAQLLGRHPAHSLDEPADDLAAVDAGVDRLADVHQQVAAQHAASRR